MNRTLPWLCFAIWLGAQSAGAQDVSDPPAEPATDEATTGSAEALPPETEDASDDTAAQAAGTLPPSALAIEPEGYETSSTEEPAAEPGPDIAEVRDAQVRVLESSTPPTPTFTFWSDDEGNYIKPVLQLSSTLVGFLPTVREDATDIAFRLSTLALARFGLEGELFGFVTFRSVFERNIGFSLARNGPVGTGVWEGTASLQPRENYIRLHQWGLSFTGGIFRDPGSVDYISNNVLDNLGMDPYVRDPLLLTGFNQGQGIMARYQVDFVEPDDSGQPRARLHLGTSFTGGNPLTSSLAFSFGGTVSSLSTLFSAPLRALSNGFPGSDIHMLMASPSVGFESQYFDIQTAAQFYWIDVDVTTEDDEQLFGWNLRSTFQVKLFDEMFRIFGTYSYRRNQQLNLMDLSMFQDFDFRQHAFGAGADFTLGPWSIGGMGYGVFSETTETNSADNVYLSLGTTYFLLPPHVSIGARWSRSWKTVRPMEAKLVLSDSFLINVRLLI